MFNRKLLENLLLQLHVGRQVLVNAVASFFCIAFSALECATFFKPSSATPLATMLEKRFFQSQAGRQWLLILCCLSFLFLEFNTIHLDTKEITAMMRTVVVNTNVTTKVRAADGIISSESNEHFSSCNVSRTLPVLMTNYTEIAIRPSFEDFSDVDYKPILRKRNPDERPFATCRFQNYRFMPHFPHFMQQLFRCWSFWESHPNHQPILMEPEGPLFRKKALRKHAFTRGLMNVLTTTTNVTIVKNQKFAFLGTNASDAINQDQDSISVKPKGPVYRPNDDHFQVTDTRHMKSLKETLMSGLNLTTPHSCGDNPKIAILNRRRTRDNHSRMILNAYELLKELRTNDEYPSMTVAYFEGRSFRDQARLMSQWDIVVTPHGAQETSLFFLGDCGGMIEIMPQKYWYPKFYGTLAATAGIHHAVLHNTNNDPEFNETKVYSGPERDADIFCPSTKAVVEALDAMVNRWRSCCEASKEKANH